MRMTNLYKARKGLIRVDAEVENNTIIGIKLTGDFFMVPEEALLFLERHLRGVELDRKLLKNAISTFYVLGVDTPMLAKDDLVKAVLGVKTKECGFPFEVI